MPAARVKAVDWLVGGGRDASGPVVQRSGAVQSTTSGFLTTATQAHCTGATLGAGGHVYGGDIARLGGRV